LPMKPRVLSVSKLSSCKITRGSKQAATQQQKQQMAALPESTCKVCS
jgi:hypothetical protein